MILDDTFLPIDAAAPPQRPNVVRLAAFQERSTVVGPGARAVVWVAGCLRRCPGCIKPEHLPFDAGEDVSVETLADQILKIKDIEGVTYSGGEPFEQSAALENLSHRLKSAGLSVVAFSGYRLASLQAQPERFGPLLDTLDLLIDGEYHQDLPGPFRWRGSANQRFHILTARGQIPAAPDEPIREVQCAISAEGMRLIGFPDQAMEHRLREELAARGVVIKRVRK